MNHLSDTATGQSKFQPSSAASRKDITDIKQNGLVVMDNLSHPSLTLHLAAFREGGRLGSTLRRRPIANGHNVQ